MHLDEEVGALLAAEFSYYGKNTGSNSRYSRDLLSRAIKTAPGFKIAVGGWLYTEPRPMHPLMPGIAPKSRERGIYGLVNMPLLETTERDRRLSGFLRIGVMHGKVNRFGHYLGSGLVMQGLWNGRPEDKTGLAFAAAFNSDRFLNSQRFFGGRTYERTELNLELSHRFYLTDWFQLQADLQYVHNPNTLSKRPDALVFGTRAIVHVSEF